MGKSSSFYISIALAIILGLVLANYIWGWTTPSANPPNDNLPAPLNEGSDNQSKVGYLAVGTSTAPEYPLDVAGVLRIGSFSTAPAGADGALYYDTTENKFKGYQGGSWSDLGGSSLWTQSGDDIYYDSGKVGIGTSTPSEELDVSGDIQASGQLKSTVAAGTAPLVVSSDTKVTNLNADKLDGYDAADLQASSFPYYYLTSDSYNGAAADTACSPGEHMCHPLELFIGRSLDLTRGISGCGTGWVDPSPGQSSAYYNCYNWSTSYSTRYGTVAICDWDNSNTPWNIEYGSGGDYTCDEEHHVYCCSDL